MKNLSFLVVAILLLLAADGEACFCVYEPAEVYAERSEVAFKASVVAKRIERIWVKRGERPEELDGYSKAMSNRWLERDDATPWERLVITVEVKRSWKQEAPRYVTLDASQGCQLREIKVGNWYLFLGAFQGGQFAMEYCGGFFRMNGRNETAEQIVEALGPASHRYEEAIQQEAFAGIQASEDGIFRQSF